MTAVENQSLEFETALLANAADYGVELSDVMVQQLSVYYQLLNGWNARLHLVAPCSPAEFAQRHVLESLLLVSYLPKHAAIADIGSGAGLPIIPCMIVRDDLSAVLFESTQRKAVFLREALRAVGQTSSAEVVAERFETAESPVVKFITSRALDRFVEMLPRLIEWSPPASTLLLFGGNELEEAFKQQGLVYSRKRIPNSEQRYLFQAETEYIPPSRQENAEFVKS